MSSSSSSQNTLTTPPVIAPALPWDTNEITRRLPHRHPFLFLDTVSHISTWDEAHAHRHIQGSDPVFAGHFPGNPVYPGALILEMMAQTSALLLQFSAGKTMTSCYMAEVRQCRFLAPALPGDHLTCHMRMSKKRPPFYWSEGRTLRTETPERDAAKEVEIARAVIIAHCTFEV